MPKECTNASGGQLDASCTKAKESDAMNRRQPAAPAPTQISDRLFCLTEAVPKSMIKHYSYFLARPAGNLLFHPLKKTSLLKRFENWFAESGGIALQVLTHDAEASKSCDWMYQRFRAGLYLHASDLPNVVRKSTCPVAKAFSSGHRLDDEVEAIPLSGHTLGFTAFRIKTPSGVFLLTGDFLVPTRAGWTANVYKLLMPV